jgi:hypothetical protein
MPSWFDDNGITDYQLADVGDVQANQGGPGAEVFASDTTGQMAGMQPQQAPGSQMSPGQQVGHDGVYNGQNREQWRDAWMSSGDHTVDSMKAWMAKNGGQWQADNGTVMTPFGESMDLGFNVRGAAAGNGTIKPIWGGGGGGPADAGGPVGDPPRGGGGFSGFGGGGGGYGGGGGGGAQGTGWDGTKFTAQTIDMPTDYNPMATADQAAYSAERVNPAGNVSAQQVQGPASLQSQQIAGAEKFGGVSEADLYADPSFKFRQAEGAKAFMANKAAAGVARTGGALKGLEDYNQQLASQEYGNVYNRKFGEYTTGLADRLNVGNSNNQNAAQAYGLSNQYQQGAQLANQGANLQAGMFNVGQQNQVGAGNADRAMNAGLFTQGQRQQNAQFNASRNDAAAQNNFANQFGVQQANNANAQTAWQGNTNAQLGQGNLSLGHTQAANTYGVGMANVGLGYHSANQSYDLGLKNNALGYTQAGNSFALGQGQNQLGWANYGLNAQGQGFNQQYSLANMGLQAAGQYGNYAGQYGANSGNNATGAGNAAAGGQIGSANAWNQGLGGAYNAGMGAYAAYRMGQNPPQGQQ